MDRLTGFFSKHMGSKPNVSDNEEAQCDATTHTSTSSSTNESTQTKKSRASPKSSKRNVRETQSERLSSNETTSKAPNGIVIEDYDGTHRSGAWFSSQSASNEDGSSAGPRAYIKDAETSLELEALLSHDDEYSRDRAQRLRDEFGTTQSPVRTRERSGSIDSMLHIVSVRDAWHRLSEPPAVDAPATSTQGTTINGDATANATSLEEAAEEEAGRSATQLLADGGCVVSRKGTPTAEEATTAVALASLSSVDNSVLHAETIHQRRTRSESNISRNADSNATTTSNPTSSEPTYRTEFQSKVDDIRAVLPQANEDEIAGALRREHGVVSRAVNTLLQWFSSNRQGESPRGEEMRFVHEFVACDQCAATPLVGRRYKCRDCDNYDLCSACFIAGADRHPHDVFLFRDIQEGEWASVIRRTEANVKRMTNSDSSNELYASQVSTISSDADLALAMQLQEEEEGGGRARAHSVVEWIAPDAVHYTSVPDREELLGLEAMVSDLAVSQKTTKSDQASESKGSVGPSNTAPSTPSATQPPPTAAAAATESDAQEDYLSMLDDMLGENDKFDLAKPLPVPQSVTASVQESSRDSRGINDDELDALIAAATGGVVEGQQDGAVANSNGDGVGSKTEFLGLLDEMVAEVEEYEAAKKTQKTPQQAHPLNQSTTMKELSNMIQRVPGARDSVSSTLSDLKPLAAPPETTSSAPSEVNLDDMVDSLLDEMAPPTKAAPVAPCEPAVSEHVKQKAHTPKATPPASQTPTKTFAERMVFDKLETKAAADALESMLDGSDSGAAHSSMRTETQDKVESGQRASAIDEVDLALATDPEIRDKPFEHALIPRGDFTMSTRMGLGVHGDAYEGVYKGNSVVVKKINRQNFNDTFLRKLTRDTSSLLQKVPEHAHIVPYLGVCIEDDVVVLRERVEGITLASLLDDADKHLEPEYLAQVAREVAEALYVLHAVGITHRSVHANNVLLDDGYHAHVCDYGLTDLKDLIRWDSSQVGRAAFVAPELYPCVQKQQYDAKVDVFAYGMLLWQVFTRMEPFADKMPKEIVALVCGGHRPLLPKRFPFVFERLIEACWHQEPENRPDLAKVLKIVRQPTKQLLFVKAEAVDVEDSKMDPVYRKKVEGVLTKIRSALLCREVNVVANGLKALSGLTGDERNVTILGASNIPQLLVTHMSTKGSDSLQLAVLFTANQWAPKPMFKEAFRRAGGLPVVVQLVEHRNRKISVAATQCIGLLAFNSPDVGENLRVAGAMDALMFAVATGVSTRNVDLMANALKSFVSMFANVSNLAEFRRLGGVSSIQELLNHSDMQIAARAADCLSRCCKDSDMRTTVIASGLIEVLVKYVRGAVLALAQMSVQHLRTMAAIDTDVAQRIKEAGALTALSAARDIHKPLIGNIDKLVNELS